MNDALSPELAAAAEPNVIAAVLAGAAPYLAQYSGKTVVIKYGGDAAPCHAGPVNIRCQNASSP